MKRPPGKAPCHGPHPADDPHWHNHDELVCTGCWAQLTRETRRRLRLSGGEGRRNPADRYDELRRQIAAAKPLNQIQVSP